MFSKKINKIYQKFDFFYFHANVLRRCVSIRFQGPKFFNSLSPEIQNNESIRLFGKRLKKFLLS